MRVSVVFASFVALVASAPLDLPTLPVDVPELPKLPVDLPVKRDGLGTFTIYKVHSR